MTRQFLAVLTATTMLVASALACGGSATPKLVSTAPPTESASTSEAQVAPTEKAEQPAEQAEQPTPALPPDTPTSAGPQVFKVGDTVKIGQSVLLVLGWSEVPATDFAKPEAGNKFIGVDVLIVNTGDSAASISSMLQTSLKDDTGQKYQVDFMALTAAQKDGIDGEIAPGERVRGTEAFQVPEAAKGLAVCV